MNFRNNKKQYTDKMNEELKSYFKEIDESLSSDKAAQEKFRARVNNTNPMLLSYYLEYFHIFGTKDAIKSAQKQYLKANKPKEANKRIIYD